MKRLFWWILALGSIAGLVALLAAADRQADGDAAHLVAVELRLSQLLADGDLGHAASAWWGLVAPQPPLGYLPGVFAFSLLGVTPLTAPLAMALSLLLCWDALSRLWGGRAWAAWLPLLASPLVWVNIEQHGRDFVAAAVLLQTLSWLWRSEGLSQARASLIFGLWLGVGFLTKYTFPIYAVLPCLLSGLVLFGRGRWGRVGNLGVALMGFGLSAGAWLIVFGTSVWRYIGFSNSDQLVNNTANYRDPSTLDSMLYYPLSLRDALSLPGLLLVLLALFVGLIRRDSRRAAVLCAAAASGGLVVLSTVPAAIDRYALPGLVTLVALLPALLGGQSRWRRALSALALLVVFLPQAWATVQTFRPGAPVAPAHYDHPVSTLWDLAWPSPTGLGPSDLDLRAWQLDRVAGAIIDAQGTCEGTIGVLAPATMAPVPNFASLLMATSAQGCHFDYATIGTRGGSVAGVFVGPLFDGSWPSAHFDTVVVVTPGQGPAGGAGRGDPGVVSWLASHPLQEHARVAGPSGGSVVVGRLLAAGPARVTPR